MLKSPVVLLAFANGDQANLLNLKNESSTLKDAFLLLEHEGLVNVEREESVTLPELEKRLRNYYDDLVIFHYAGHANSVQLLFEEGKVGGRGIAAMLGQAPHLQLVFLNACETKAQADVFLDQGVKVVIATSQPINDAMAIRFSRTFYESISRKATIQESFDRAKAFVEASASDGKKRSLVFMTEEDGEGEVIEPWKLYWRDEQELAWKIDIDVKIMLNLRLGSQNFLNKLLAGPLIHHQGLLRRQEVDFDDLHHFTTVNIDNSEELLLPHALESLWKKKVPHAWLYGSHGTGKTGSILLMWNRLLHLTQTQKTTPIPVFVDLEDYSDKDKTYILSFISKYYLELEGYSEYNEKEAIGQIMKRALVVDQVSKRVVPTVVLFLDGSFAEGTTLEKEIKELAQHPGVQIICTTNNPDQQKASKLGFHFLEIKPLEEDEIKEKIKQDLDLFRPEIRQLVRTNRLWLSLFFEMYDKVIVESDEGNMLKGPEYEFFSDFTTPAEFLWNYFEARLFSVTSTIVEDDTRRSRLRFNRFFIRHFIPKLVFHMEHDGVQEITEDELLDSINSISHHFYQPWFLKAFPEYRRDFKHFFLETNGWVEESERLAVVIELCKDFSIFTEGFKTYSVNQPGKEYQHLHKVRTYKISNDYFFYFLTALHIWQDIKAGLFSGNFPSTLKEQEISEPVLIMLGQLDGIHRNSDEQVLLMLLERCRGVFEQKIVGKTVWNILQVWNNTNGNYMGLSLAKLDLRGIPLHRLSKELSYEPYFLSSDLSSSLVEYQDIFRKKGGHVVDFVYSQDGHVIVTGECDGTIRQWDTELNICYKIIEGHTDQINAVCITSTVKYIISGSADGTIRFWDQQTERCLMVLGDGGIESGHSGPILSLAWHPIARKHEGQFWLVSSAQDNLVFLWKIDLLEKTAEKIHTLAFHQDAVRSVDIFVDKAGKKTIIAGSWDNTVSYWDGDTGALKSVLDLHVSRVHCVRFCPDGEFFASGSSDDTVIIWKTDDPNRVQRRLKGHNRGIESLQFKEVGKGKKKELHLVSAASGDKIVVWNLQDINWEVPLLNLSPHYDQTSEPAVSELRAWKRGLGYGKEVNCVAFKPNSDRLAYATSDGRLRIWNLHNHSFHEEAILYNIYELHVQGCRFMNLHEKSNLFAKETTFLQEQEGEKEVTKEMLLRQYGAIMNKNDEANWQLIVEKMKRR